MIGMYRTEKSRECTNSRLCGILNILQVITFK